MSDETTIEENQKPKFNSYKRNDRKSTFEEAWKDLNPSAQKPGSYADVKRVARKYYDKEQAGQIDSMTKLSNREGTLIKLNGEIKRALRNGTEIALFYMDLNNLKEHNDTLGHKAGDKLLIDLAKTLKDSARPTDITGRIGGDEILVALPETDIVKALGYWSKIDEIIKKGTNAWISAGVAVINPKSITKSEEKRVEDIIINNARDKAINMAEEAMREAKSLAKERYAKIGIKENVLKTVQEASTISPGK